MGVAESFRAQADSLNAAADAIDRLLPRWDALLDRGDQALAQQDEARHKAQTAPAARLLRPDGTPVTPLAPPGAPIAPGATNPALTPRTTAGPGAGAALGGDSGAGTGRTGRIPFELWAANACELKVVPLPDPRNPLVTVDTEVWDCTKAGAGIYLVHPYVTATRGKTRSTSTGGGGGGFTSATGRSVPPPKVQGGAANDVFFNASPLSAGREGADGVVGREIIKGLVQVVGELRTLNRKVASDDGGMSLRAGRLV